MGLIAADEKGAAEELFEECVALSRVTGDGMHQVTGLYHLGGLAMLRGDRARDRLEVATAVAPGRSSVHGADHAPEMLGRALVDLDEVDLGAELIHSALNGYQEVGVVRDATLALARDRLAADEFDTAWRDGGALDLPAAVADARSATSG